VKTTHRERMRRFLEKTAPVEYSPTALSRKLGMKLGTVTKELTRLVGQLEIEKTGRGLYRGLTDLEKMARVEDASIKLHSLRFRFNGKQAGRDIRYLPAAPRKVTKNFIQWIYDWKDSYQQKKRKVTIHLYKTGTYVIFLKCSSAPLGFPEYAQFWNWLRGLFQGIGIDLEDPTVSCNVVNYEFNTDFCIFSLSGAQSMTVTLFNNTWYTMWYRAYNKSIDGQKKLRIEVGSNIPLTPIDIMDIIKSFVSQISRGESK